MLATILLAFAGAMATPSDDAFETITLKNGIQVHLLPFEGSKHFAMFSIVPYGLTTDGEGKAQWSHLIEHLIATSIQPTYDYQQINAETMFDCMHLDFVREAEHWREGVERHATWLAVPKFSQEDMDREVPRVIDEVAGLDAQGMTAKFALAAWSQVAGWGTKDVSMNEHLRGLKAEAINEYASGRLFDGHPAQIVVAGAFDRESLVPVLEEKIGSLELAEPQPLEAPKEEPELPEIASWDLATPHYFMFWPVPTELRSDGLLLDLARLLAYTAWMQRPGAPVPEGTYPAIESRAYAGGRMHLVISVKINDASPETLAAAKAHGEAFGVAMPKIIPRTYVMMGKQTAMTVQQLRDPEATLARSVDRYPRRMIEGNLAVQLGLTLFHTPEGLEKRIERLQGLGEKDRDLLLELFDPKTRREVFVLPR